MSADWTLRNECHCGHHKDTHFEGRHACLGMYCDCDSFAKNDKPRPPKTLKVPMTQSTYDPVDWSAPVVDDDDGGPITPRMLPWTFP